MKMIIRRKEQQLAAKAKIKQEIQRYRETRMDTISKMTEESQQVSLLTQEESGEEAQIEELWQGIKAKQATVSIMRIIRLEA